MRNYFIYIQIKNKKKSWFFCFNKKKQKNNKRHSQLDNDDFLNQSKL